MSLSDFNGANLPYSYAALGVVIGFLLYAMRWMGTGGTTVLERGAGLAADPYLIAFLRGGDREVVRVAALSLFDRGLLTVTGVTPGQAPGEDMDLLTEQDVPRERARRPIEQTILRTTASRTSPYTLIWESELKASQYFDQALVDKGLLRGGLEKMIHRFLAVLAIGAFLGIGVVNLKTEDDWGLRTKTLMALAVLFLPFCVDARITPRGRKAIADLRTLFEPLERCASSLAPGGDPNDLALTAAVFGLKVIPVRAYPLAPLLKQISGRSSLPSSRDSDDD
jgi:uncharacterized protein (TIGR04222 family)